MKIVITDASGRIGNVVVRKLLDTGHEVRVLQRRESRALNGLTVERVSGHLFLSAAPKRTLWAAYSTGLGSYARQSAGLVSDGVYGNPGVYGSFVLEKNTRFRIYLVV